MSTIKELWNRSGEELAGEKAKNTLMLLQATAEQEILKRKISFDKVKSNLDSAIMNAQKEQSYKAIVDAKVAVKIAEKEYNIAVESYKEDFGTDPKIAD